MDLLASDRMGSLSSSTSGIVASLLFSKILFSLKSCIVSGTKGEIFLTSSFIYGGSVVEVVEVSIKDVVVVVSSSVVVSALAAVTVFAVVVVRGYMDS